VPTASRGIASKQIYKELKGFMHLDTRTHRFPSADGRHWSAPELADFADGKLSQEQTCIAQQARIAVEGAYQPRFKLSPGLREAFRAAILKVHQK
jgi:hypothetical protein